MNRSGSVATPGRLSADELRLSDTVYDPDVHYEEVERKWWGISITHANGRTELLDTLDDWGTPDVYAGETRMPFGLRR